MAKLSFNAATHKPMEERSFILIPEGEYLVQMVKSDIKRNTKNTGDRLNFQAKILAGEHKGSMLFVGLNLNHENQEAQDISDREFKSICDAVGKGADLVEETEELHGIPFIATVVHSAPSGEYKENGETKFKYKPKAEIKKYEPAKDSPLMDGVDTGGEETKTAPPWKKKEEEAA